MNHLVSKLSLFSLGIVVNDKPDDSDFIDVYPVEHLPFADGKVSEFKEEMENNLPDKTGLVNPEKIEQSIVMRAKWIPFGHSNRMTSPDVIKNETVILFKYADTDDYYWSTIFREPGIRRQETVTYMYGNLKTPLVTWNKSSSYWFEVSTKNKNVTLKTTKSDGEPFEYTVNIDTKKGSLSALDDKGQGFILNSSEGVITIKANNKITLDAPSIVNTGNVTNMANETTHGLSKARCHTPASGKC